MIEVRRGDGRIELLPFDLFEEEVRQGGIDADTPMRFGPVTGEDFVPAGGLELWRSVEDSPQTRFERAFDLRRLSPVTLLFSGFLALVFLWQVHEGPALGPAE